MDRTKEGNEFISSGNVSYYDRIADQYDTIQNNDKRNAAIRNRVAAFFTNLVKEGKVLDFGGGTGLDLNWLARRRYDISFCEPSAAMRKVAIERWRIELPGSSIVFLEDGQSDFRKWNAEFPFDKKVDAVLANFAVVNCIPDVRCLFEKLALVLSPGGVVVILVLDAGIIQKLRTNLKGTIRFLITGNPVDFHIDFNGERQLVQLYSTFEIRKAAKGYFRVVHSEQWSGFGFSLIHLMKK
jgi:SAM-dependent methyltransferase